VRTLLSAATFGVVAIVGTVLHVPVVGLCIALGAATVVCFFGSLVLLPRYQEHTVQVGWDGATVAASSEDTTTAP
jgi:hypothetical protein